MMNRLSEAVACFDRATQIDPTYFPAWQSLMFVLQSSAGRAAAVATLQKAEEQHLDEVGLCILRGDLASYAKDNDEARRQYERALETDRDNENAVAAMAGFYSDTSFEFSKALSLRRELSRKYPSPIGWLALAEDSLKAGEVAEARALARQLLKEGELGPTYECIARLVLLTGVVLGRDASKRSDEIRTFLRYLTSLDSTFVIPDTAWILDGLLHRVSLSRVDPGVKLILLFLIRLLQGKEDRTTFDLIRP